MSTTGKVIIVFLILAFFATAGIVYFKGGLNFKLKQDEINKPAYVPPPAPLKPSLAEAGQDALADAQEIAAGLIAQKFGNVQSNVSQVPGSVT